jgi:tRNA pseudouridine55 synthase
MNGALIVDKPSGPTSHDIVALARRALGESRIGHTGTLDPLATGVLVLLVGRATRLSQFLVSDEKEYIADVRLGVSTPTYDSQSRPETGTLTVPPGPERGTLTLHPESAANGECPPFLDRALDRFRGTFLQTPPPFSAKKIAGRRAYEHARNERPVELKPVEVTVTTLEVIGGTPDPPSDRASADKPDEGLLRLRIVCSSGFYVRSLAHDLGQALGCGAHLEALRRTRAGQFALDRAVPVEIVARTPELAREHVISMADLLGHLAAVTVSEEGARRVAHGNAIAPDQVIREHLTAAGGGGHVSVLDASGTLLAVAERGPDASLHPLTVLV